MCAQPLPILKTIVSAPVVEFAVMMACRNDPAPPSCAVVTEMVAASAHDDGSVAKAHIATTARTDFLITIICYDYSKY